MNTLEPPFVVIDQRLQCTLGHKLLTLSYIVVDEQVADRIYSSQPTDYPVGGKKPLDKSDWQCMMEQGECFIANRPEEFGEHFTDLETIVSLGFASVVNMPVMQDGALIGSINLLDEADAYRDRERVLAVFAELQPLIDAAFRAYQDALAARS